MTERKKAPQDYYARWDMPNPNEGIVPSVGMGVTMLVGSDRYAGTIIKVYPNKRRFIFQKDHATRVGRRNRDRTVQKYRYARNPNAEEESAYLSKDNVWLDSKVRRCHVHLNTRDRYKDPDF